MESPTPAEQALQLLFKKLHPHLEDAAQALRVKARPQELEGLHLKLVRACGQAAEILDQLAGTAAGELAETLATLSANLTPVGGNYRQQLTLVQLCLEEAPADLLPFAPPGAAAGSLSRPSGHPGRPPERSGRREGAEARWFICRNHTVHIGGGLQVDLVILDLV